VTIGTRLFANLGAEEESGWLRMADHPRVRTVARLWAALFPAGARTVGPGAPPPPRLAGALAGTAGTAAFPFCDVGAALVPWLATREAEALARDDGVPLAASAPEVTRRVHDKGFALEAARASGLVPDTLADATLVLAAEELDEADAVRCRIEAEVARWPEALRARFTLKPRHGTSGRGRLAGLDGRIDVARVASALVRLRAAGGAIVEPWLERTLDLSAQLYVAGPDDVHVLGTLRQVLTTHGGPVGHAGRMREDGSVDAGTPWDEALRAAAATIGRAAGRVGFRGVCGLDALVFRDGASGAEILRPVVELNARFTAGTVALGHVARAVRAGLMGDARAFYFGFAVAGGAWPGKEVEGVRRFTILDDDSTARLCLAADARALDEILSIPRRSE
jgi:hypothetical protein